MFIHKNTRTPIIVWLLPDRHELYEFDNDHGTFYINFNQQINVDCSILVWLQNLFDTFSIAFWDADEFNHFAFGQSGHYYIIAEKKKKTKNCCIYSFELRAYCCDGRANVVATFITTAVNGPTNNSINNNEMHAMQFAIIIVALFRIDALFTGAIIICHTLFEAEERRKKEKKAKKTRNIRSYLRQSIIGVLDRPSNNIITTIERRRLEVKHGRSARSAQFKRIRSTNIDERYSPDERPILSINWKHIEPAPSTARIEISY